MQSALKTFVKRIPILGDLFRLRDAAENLSAGVLEQQAETFARDLLGTPRYRDPRRLNHAEARVYSQSGEDGILSEIFRRIGTSDRYFVEMGVDEGRETNTTYLLSQGWQGVWYECDPRSVRAVRRQFREPLGSGQLRLKEAFVTAETINDLFAALAIPREFDLLSLDVDRNTYYLWRALRDYRPRVVVVEYNAVIPPTDAWVVRYDPGKSWNGSSYFGASLKSYELLGREYGYSLVGCGIAGSNAFFVRDDLVGANFHEPFTAEEHYEPPRYWLTKVRIGYRRAFVD